MKNKGIDSKKIVILGAGGWGTALSIVLNCNNHSVSLWEINKDLTERFIKEHENKTFLPGVVVPEDIKITSDMSEALSEKEMIIFAIPSHYVRSVAESIKKFDLRNKTFISVVKGIENNTLLRISEILREVISDANEENLAILSGPSHAEEVARKIPTAVTIASKNAELSLNLQKIFMNQFFRVYASSDVTGAELGGALKNIIALAAGICDGAELGDNTKAALLTRGLAEITRLGVTLGADSKTFSGLSGMGVSSLKLFGLLYSFNA